MPVRRAAVLAAAALLFVVVFVLLIVAEDADHPVALLFALPVAIIAVELGLAGGLAAAALALGLLVFWSLTLAGGANEASAFDYVSWGTAYALLGGVAGALADNLRRVSADSARLWELSSDMLCTAGFDGRFKRLNVAWERTLGWTAHELLAQPFIELVHPDDRERTEAEAQRLATAGYRTLNFENRYRHKDGSYRTMLWAATSIPEEELIYATARDLSDRKLVEEAAEAARAEAEQANRAKSEFLSRVSHELRTPLNAILGFGQLLEMEALEDSQRESVDQILLGGRLLLQVIDELLDISRIETGNMSLSIEPVEASQLLADAMTLCEPLASEHALELTRDVPEQPLWVMADAQRLKQALLNLLSNAIKYNRRYGSVAAIARTDGEAMVRLEVTDTGVGMTDEQQGRLFNPFERLNAGDRAIEGTGLGLALSKALVEAMGGRLTVRSDFGIGSTFSVLLRAAGAPEVADLSARATVGRALATAPAIERNGSPGTVMCVEDNPANLDVVRRVIVDHVGAHFLPVSKGWLALEQARERRPDLILLDVHLSDMSGADVLTRLRGDSATRHIPVIVLSADATDRQVRRMLALGAEEYLTKPIDVQRLLEEIGRRLRAVRDRSST